MSGITFLNENELDMICTESFRKRTPFQGKLRLTHTAQFEYDLAWELMEDIESQSHESMTLR